MGLTHTSTGSRATDPGFKLLRQPDDRIIALAGNPNVGKSTIFNALTGLRQHTGNWPGKTVTCAQGRATHAGQGYVLVDLPGTYSLSARSEEEAVTRDFLRSGGYDCVVVVCDAACLERNLILALQVLELTDRAVLCVNLLDEAEKRGVQVDLPALSQRLGIPVVGTAAGQGRGLGALMAAVQQVCAQPTAKPPVPPQDEHQRVVKAEGLTRSSVTRTKENGDARDRALDRLFTSRRTGIPIMLALLAFVLWLTIAGANVPSELLSHGLLRLQEALTALFARLHAPDWLHGALVLGVYRVLAWVVSVMLPPMAIFFPLFTLLEDFGYLPRVAFVLDHAFQKAKTCGKQALTMCVDHMILSFGDAHPLERKRPPEDLIRRRALLQLIRKVVIHAPDKSSGKHRQKAEIFFNFVDEVEIPVLAEPMIAESILERGMNTTTSEAGGCHRVGIALCSSCTRPTRDMACQPRKACCLPPVNGLSEGILNCLPSSSSFS